MTESYINEQLGRDRYCLKTADIVLGHIADVSRAKRMSRILSANGRIVSVLRHDGSGQYSPAMMFVDGREM